MAGGAFLASILLSLFGFVSGAPEQVESASLGIRIAFSALPFVLWVITLRLLRRYDLTEDKFNLIKDKLQRSHSS